MPLNILSIFVVLILLLCISVQHMLDMTIVRTSKKSAELICSVLFFLFAVYVHSPRINQTKYIMYISKKVAILYYICIIVCIKSFLKV